MLKKLKKKKETVRDIFHLSRIEFAKERRKKKSQKKNLQIYDGIICLGQKAIQTNEKLREYAEPIIYDISENVC